jgi:peptide deformylase
MERLSEIIPYRTEERGCGCLPVREAYHDTKRMANINVKHHRLE